MTHLGFERFAVVGMCIGGPYIMNLLKLAPQRVVASAVMQTIGDNNRQEFLAMFDGWAEQLHQSDPSVTGPRRCLACADACLKTISPLCV